MKNKMTLEERYKEGFAKLKEIDGEAGENVINSLKGIADDLGEYIIGFGFGEVYSRPNLDLKSREIATLGFLCTLGTIPQLKVHIKAALNVGVKKEEIIEIFIQSSLYVGFPKALNAVFAAKEIFEELGIL